MSKTGAGLHYVYIMCTLVAAEKKKKKFRVILGPGLRIFHPCIQIQGSSYDEEIIDIFYYK